MSDPKDHDVEIEDLDSTDENPTGGRGWRKPFSRNDDGGGPNDGCMGNPQFPCNPDPDPDPDPGPNDDCMGNPQFPCGDGAKVKGFKF